MKTEKLFLHHHSPILRTASIFLLVAFLNLEMGCNYFRVQTMDRLTEELTKSSLQKYQSENKYIILDSGGKQYHLSSIEVDQATMKLTCNIEPSEPKHQMYAPNGHSNKRYRNKFGEYVVLNEVHILADNFKKTGEGKAEIDLSSVKRIDIIEKDTGRTVASYIFTTLAIAGGVFALMLIIVALTKSSCPFVYVQDGQSFVFKGELFGGAIFKPLERDDFIALKTLGESDSVLNIKISNELKERQYTNIAEAIIAEHNVDQKTLIDSKGIVHTISNPVPPSKAILNNSDDYTQALQKIDSSSCLFNSQGRLHESNELVLAFDKPASARNAKIVLHAKNSLWLDFAFGEMTRLFGSYYGKWIERQRTGNADSMISWSVKQNLPLSVYVKKGGQWQLAERIPTIGPLASRDLCIPVDVDPSEKLEVKLSCGFMFWEIDYAAVDFSQDMPVVTQTLKPSFAMDENGKNITHELSFTDEDYLFQPGPGCETGISYTLPKRENGKVYDVYLHTRGFYEHVRDYTGLPDKKLLESFRNEGAFSEFSKKLYEITGSSMGLTVQNTKPSVQ